MTEKLLEKKWIVTCYLLLIPAALRLLDKLTESGLLTIWGLAAGAFLTAEVVEKATSKESS